MDGTEEQLNLTSKAVGIKIVKPNDDDSFYIGDTIYWQNKDEVNINPVDANEIEIHLDIDHYQNYYKIQTVNGAYDIDNLTILSCESRCYEKETDVVVECDSELVADYGIQVILTDTTE